MAKYYLTVQLIEDENGEQVDGNVFQDKTIIKVEDDGGESIMLETED